MMRETGLLETQDVRSFFQEALTDLIGQRDMDVGDSTVAYVTNLLATFMRSDRFYEWTPDGPTLTPLAMLYSEVLQAPSTRHRQQMLRRLGDVALFVAGVFAESFHRKSYGVDYYIGMGGAAYGSLSGSLDGEPQGQTHSRVFSELSSGFADFVQVLAELCNQADIRDDRDILRWYEVWLRTGSARAEKRLRGVGIDVDGHTTNTRH